MLTAVLLSLPGFTSPFAPAGLLHTPSVCAKLLEVSASLQMQGKQIYWITDLACAALWPDAETCGQPGPAILEWIDSTRDTWLLASTSSLRFLLPQIDRLIICKIDQSNTQADDQQLSELNNLTDLEFVKSDLTGLIPDTVFWRRPACAEIIAELTSVGNCDLHLHTNRSDGADSPEELVERVIKAGLDAFAITDHDNLAALEPASQYLTLRTEETGRKVMFIPGVELAIESGRELHLLAYFPRGGHEVIVRFLEQQQQTRRERNVKMIRILQDLGYSISMADFEADGEGTIGRLQAALILRDRGHFNSVDEAFAQLLSPGKPGYIDRQRPSAAEAIWLIRQAGGVAVLAHPADYGWCDGRPIVGPFLLSQLEALKKAGLQGVEAFHGEAQQVHQLEISAAARALGLIRTAGSDDHGANKEHAHLYVCGSQWLEPGEIMVVAALIAGPQRNGQSTWLVTRRSTPGTGYGQWELPGGKVEPGESPADALVRELQEELGINARVGRRRHVLTYKYPARRVILISYEVESEEKTWQLSVHDEARFVTAAEALTMSLLPADFYLFDDLMN